MLEVDQIETSLSKKDLRVAAGPEPLTVSEHNDLQHSQSSGEMHKYSLVNKLGSRGLVFLGCLSNE